MKRLTELNSEQKNFISSNIGLVHYIVQKQFNIPINSKEYDETISHGTFGLIKAAINYDESKNVKFSAFAIPCISNEIRMYFRKNKKYTCCKSFEEDIYLLDSSKDNMITSLKDIIEDTKVNIERDYIDKEAELEILDIIINCLEPRTFIILLYRIDEIEQRIIANKLGIHRSYVSRIESKGFKEVRRIIDEKMTYTKTFVTSKEYETYCIEFLSKDLENWDMVWIKIQIKEKNLHNLHIEYEEKSGTVRMYMNNFFTMAEIFSIILHIP